VPLISAEFKGVRNAELYRQRRLVAGGPFADGSGALLV
jgi:hypothetical protein